MSAAETTTATSIVRSEFGSHRAQVIVSGSNWRRVRARVLRIAAYLTEAGADFPDKWAVEMSDNVAWIETVSGSIEDAIPALATINAACAVVQR